MKLNKFESVPPEIKKLFEEYGLEIRIGDIFIDARNPSTLIKIRTIETTNSYNNEGVKSDDLSISYDHNLDYEGTRWGSYGSSSLRTWKHDKYIKLDKPIIEYFKEALDVIDGRISLDVYSSQEDEKLNSETSLIHKSSKEGLMAMQKGLEEKKNKAELIRAFVGLEMEKRKAALDVIRSKMEAMIVDMNKKIKKIMRVITTIELYLGINEELFQIQDGEKANATTPISFRQMVLYIDEEIGHWKNGGLDWTNIDWFDNWLTDPEHLQQVLPEPKGIVVFRPRRTDKDYGEDARYGAAMNDENMRRTYLLIRNGDALYRVYTENIIIYPRLFPQRKELQELMDTMSKEDDWSDRKKDQIENEMYQYRKRAILLQGLIDRTEVFHPLPAEKVSIFNLNELGDKVNFIYDDEASLPTGRLPFNRWWKEMDEKIDHGSRILITGEYSRLYDYSDRREHLYADRFYLAKNSYDGLKNVPDMPKEGVYEVERFRSSTTQDYRETSYKEALDRLKDKNKRFKDEGVVNGKYWRIPDEKTGSKEIFRIRTYSEEEDLTIMYKPKEESSTGWNRWDTHERKVRARFKIEKGDDFVMNYDQVSLGDVEFYLKSRVDRPNYLKMMPVLEKIKAHLLEEKKREAEFVKFISLRNQKNESVVWDAVDWWKFKNKIKRHITKDDTLALRMIESRIKKVN